MRPYCGIMSYIAGWSVVRQIRHAPLMRPILPNGGLCSRMKNSKLSTRSLQVWRYSWVISTEHHDLRTRHILTIPLSWIIPWRWHVAVSYTHLRAHETPEH